MGCEEIQSHLVQAKRMDLIFLVLFITNFALIVSYVDQEAFDIAITKSALQADRFASSTQALAEIVNTATTQTITTTKTACSNGSRLFLAAETRHTFLINAEYWMYRYSGDTKWNTVYQCNSSKPSILLMKFLPDGTRVAGGANKTLFVEQSPQSNSRHHIQFMFEVRLTDYSFLRHIFNVHFTTFCVPTVMGAKLNVTEILLGMYKSEHLVEVALFENGTKFAYMNTAKGAAVTGNNHPVAGFGNRLKVTDGSLIITHIMATDNGPCSVSASNNPPHTDDQAGSLNNTSTELPTHEAPPTTTAEVEEPTTVQSEGPSRACGQLCTLFFAVLVTFLYTYRR
ncbi:hypothetical protein P5673_017559 [Acropora cervicornis]|uniref:Uncharacterized protein n=1 Tax=Acropora cervicornis TaxID=6130 RepID=A0AAD9QES4_ACRCE|nr:hypothetical protein P5673_017559 [Acropora cervicornis]